MDIADLTSGFAPVNGTQLYYESAGNGAPVVFVHGLCLDTRMWDEQFHKFAQRYRAIRYDIRGFGRSALPSDAPFRYADDLHALLAYLGVRAAHLVGLSMGGRIALHHALLYPAATTSLVLVDSALDGFGWNEEWIASLDAIAARGHQRGAAAANQMWLEHELFAPAREQRTCAEKLARIVGECSGWNWTHDAPAIPLDPPAARRLHEVAAPALVVVGERDLPDFLQIADKLAAEIPGAERAVMPGVGHMSNMENPTEFNALLLRFLQARSPAG